MSSDQLVFLEVKVGGHCPISDILQLFGWRNFIFIREKSQSMSLLLVKVLFCGKCDLLFPVATIFKSVIKIHPFYLQSQLSVGDVLCWSHWYMHTWNRKGLWPSSYNGKLNSKCLFSMYCIQVIIMIIFVQVKIIIIELFVFKLVVYS